MKTRIELPESQPIGLELSEIGVIGKWHIGYLAAVFVYDDGYTVDENGSALGEPDELREWAAVLLAAAKAAERAKRHARA